MGIRASAVLILLLTAGFAWDGQITRLRHDLRTAEAPRRREVIRLLAGYDPSRVRADVLHALADRDVGVRVEVARAVGRLGLTEAIPTLTDWLGDDAAGVRESAARTLGPLLAANPATTTRVARTSPLASLIRVLGDSEARVRAAAVTSLGQVGSDDEVISPLLGRLDDTDPTVRRRAVEALAQLDDPRAVIPLVGRARDDTPDIRAAVYGALGRLRDRRATAAVLRGLHDPVHSVKLAAIRALGRLGSAHAVTPLRALAEGTDVRTARAAVAALAAIPEADATAAVVDALQRAQTRAVATAGLLRRLRRDAISEKQAARRVPLAVEVLGPALSRASQRAHVDAIAALIGQLKGAARRESIARLLGQTLDLGKGTPRILLRALASAGSDDALMPIATRLEESSRSVQAASLDALEVYFDAHGPDGRAADPLLRAFSHVHQDLRPQVVYLLGRTGAVRTRSLLRTLLRDPKNALREPALQALAHIGDPKSTPTLLTLLDDPKAETRAAAARAFASSATPVTLRMLIQRLKKAGPIDRHHTITALGGSLHGLRARNELSSADRDAALRMLLRLSRGPDERLAAQALDTLAQLGDAQTVAPLAALLRTASRARRHVVARTLGAIDAEPARVALRAAFRRNLPSVRASAAAALGTHGTAQDIPPLMRAARRASFPIDAAASFALARLARRDVLTPATYESLCELRRSRGPWIRTNALIALAAAGAPPCQDTGSLRALLGARHAAAVRTAAARRLVALDDDPVAPGHICDRDHGVDALETQCDEPAWPPLDTVADVYAYHPQGSDLLVHKLIALRLGDGTTLLTWTDANGRIHLTHAPVGPLVLEDPSRVPIEPRLP